MYERDLQNKFVILEKLAFDNLLSLTLFHIFSHSCPEIFIQEFSMEITSNCIINKSFLLFGFIFSLVSEYSIFIPSIHREKNS